MDSTDVLDPPEVDEVGPPRPPADDAAAWKFDKNGKQYVPRTDGRPGIINRQGEETVDAARDRDAKSRDQRPKRKPKSQKPPMPKAPAKVDLKELEAVLAEAFQAPAMPCAMFGDEWAANHFTTQGPYLARNLVIASQHNPWLRRKLEDAASGQDAAMKLLAIAGVAGALFGYAVPPVVWWMNIAVPDRARDLFGIPPRRDEPDNARPIVPPAPAATGAFAA